MKKNYLEKTSIKLEGMGKKKFYLFCLADFIFFLIFGLIGGYGLKIYRIYQLKNFQGRLEKEAEERLTNKLEKYQLQLNIPIIK